AGNGSVTISPAAPTVAVSGGPFPYDGTPHAASATAIGVGGAAVSGTFSFTYNGSATTPTNAGSYAVVATFTSSDPNYGNTNGNGGIIINPAKPTVTVNGGPFYFDGTPHAASAPATGVGGVAVGGTTTVAASGAFSFTYNGSAATPTNAGTYAVVATFTSSDPNYGNTTGNGSITINPVTPTVKVNGGPFNFDGTPHAASATATGVGGVAV